jgi:hypothetical protein
MEHFCKLEILNVVIDGVNDHHVNRFSLLTRFRGVTIDGVWIGEWVY